MRKVEESEIYGVIGTAVICGLIFLLLFLFGMKTVKEFPPPPSGVEIMFGDGAIGAPAPELSSIPTETSIPEPSIAQPSTAPNLLTQDDPSVAIEAERKKQEERQRQEQIKQEQIRLQQEKAAREAAEKLKAEQAAKAAAANALAAGAFGGGGQDASGMGPGGGGTGNTPGNPLGKGSGLVGGTGWSLAGRDWKGGGMSPSYVGSQTGVIIVSIRVDKNGNVIAASIKQKGTTISDADQRAECIRTAKQAKFSTANGATEDALGEITYRFSQR
jgi:TonB family protein